MLTESSEMDADSGFQVLVQKIADKSETDAGCHPLANIKKA